MNKKAKFDWVLFIILMIILCLAGLAIYGITSAIEQDTSKYENLCEKKGMEYFAYRAGSTLGARASIICLDNDGDQHEVKLI